MPAPGFDSKDLARLQSQLHLWRGRQTGRPRLPHSLWQAATVLARSHGVSCVARTLGLGYHRLRHLTAMAGSTVNAPLRGLPCVAASSSGFVELHLPPAPMDASRSASPRGVIEISGPSQRRCRIEMDVDAELCVRLVELFLGSEP